MALTVLLVAAALFGGSVHWQDDPTDGVSRVRPLDRASTVLVQEGRRRSPTIISLVECVNSSSLVVYIATGPDIASRGALSFLAHGGELTYVMVRLKPTLPPLDRLAALGHELQHACEIARAPVGIESETALGQLYQRIGFSVGLHAYESSAARAAEASVRREVRAPRAR